jgi:hypothetical protein
MKEKKLTGKEWLKMVLPALRDLHSQLIRECEVWIDEGKLLSAGSAQRKAWGVTLATKRIRSIIGK